MMKNNHSDEESENDDDKQPNGAECFSRCKQFAEITGTDTALAMFYLQDTKWNLGKSLDKFFQSVKQSKSKIVACFDLEELDQDERYIFLLV
jgi:hypothetical protein